MIEPRTPEEARALNETFERLDRELMAIHTLGGAFVLLGVFLLIKAAVAGIRGRFRDALAYGLPAIGSLFIGGILTGYDEVW